MTMSASAIATVRRAAQVGFNRLAGDPHAQRKFLTSLRESPSLARAFEIGALSVSHHAPDLREECTGFHEWWQETWQRVQLEMQTDRATAPTEVWADR
jgi:hypothetical protein